MQSNNVTHIRILIVEDEPNVGALMRARLESYGYMVHGVVSSGEEALSAMESRPVDLVIMDIKIRGEMDGIEVAGFIRAEFDVPIIFLTSYADDDLLERAQATEPFDYIVKPYDGRQLHIAVEMALYKHRLDGERRQLVRELKAALATVKKLSGLLPICASCKKIRDDTGYWDQVESYIKKHSEAEFTHSICPECMRKLYPEYACTSKSR